MRTNHYFLTHSERLVCQNIRIGNIGYLIEGLIFPPTSIVIFPSILKSPSALPYSILWLFNS